MTRVKLRRPAKAALRHSGENAVELVPIDMLKPCANNARTHSDRQLTKIAASLEAFGWMNPVLAEQDGTIIAGHGRWQAAKSLGQTQVPVIRFEHLSPDELRAYRLADNRLAELSGYDEDILAIELQHLSSIDIDFNIEVLGWDHAEIDIMLDPPASDPESAEDPADQEIPLPPMQPVAKTGDLWLLGDHRLYCGSSLDAISFTLLMDGRKARMAFQDAPYNCPVDGHVSGLGKVKHREFAMATGEMSDDEFRRFLATNLSHVCDHLVEGAILSLCMDWRQLFQLQLATRDVGLDTINLAVWVKNNAGMGSLLRSKHELVLLCKHGRAPHINNVELGRHGRYRTNVWPYAGVNSFGRGRMEQLGVHPTCKPIPLVADAIRDVSNRGDIILDSYMGSGTTLLAAERTGRIGYGMDIDPAYIDVTIRRWQMMTGRKAVHAVSQMTFDNLEQGAVIPSEKTGDLKVD
jgi:DNA modification methylase